jgi:hypothetical protein
MCFVYKEVESDSETDTPKHNLCEPAPALRLRLLAALFHFPEIARHVSQSQRIASVMNLSVFKPTTLVGADYNL